MTMTTMTPTAPAGAGALMPMPMSIDYKKAVQRARKFQEVAGVGGGSSGNRTFPGTQISFNKGAWVSGFGEDRSELRGTRLVFNFPHTLVAWMKWEETDDGKRYPRYEGLTYLAQGAEPIEREALGDLDENDWPLDQNGHPIDPWRAILVVPVRSEDSTEVNHVMLTTKSATRAGFDAFVEWAESQIMHSGELPVIALGSEQVSRTVEVATKRGKPQKVKQVWDIPTFSFVTWISAEKCDLLPMSSGNNGSAVSEDEAENADGDNEKGRAKALTDKSQWATSGRGAVAKAPEQKTKRPAKIEVDDEI